MLKRKIFVLMCLVATTVSSINAQNYEGYKEDMRIVVNNTDFSVNTDLTSYFDGQTPTPFSTGPSDTTYNTVYYVPTVYKDPFYITNYAINAETNQKKAYIVKDQCYIMKMTSDFAISPHFTTRFGGFSSYDNVIAIVAIDNATGDTIINSSFNVDQSQSGITIGFEDTYIGKLILLEITTYGLFPEATSEEKYFTIQRTYEYFSDHYKMAFGIPDTEYNIYTGVYNQSAQPEGDEFVTVYDATGHVIRANVEKASGLDGLKSGIYIVNGKKIMVNNK